MNKGGSNQPSEDSKTIVDWVSNVKELLNESGIGLNPHTIYLPIQLNSSRAFLIQ